jgi:hypothetical protein
MEILGHKVIITALPNPRQFEYQIDNEKIQPLEVGSTEEAILCVTRILEHRADPRNAPAPAKPVLGAKPEKTESKPPVEKPVEHHHKGVTPDGKPSTI